jgi:hypothetical protein
MADHTWQFIHKIISIPIVSIYLKKNIYGNRVTMSSVPFTRQAFNVLLHNYTTPESVLQQMVDSPNTIMTYVDANEETWSFIARRRCRLFLLAKTTDMKKYEDIYCSATL